MGAKSRRNKRRRVLDPMRALEQKLKRSNLGQAVTLINSPEGAEKMSEVIQRFIAPYMDLDHNRQEMERLLMVAIIAWNAAIVPPGDSKDLLTTTRKDIEKAGGRQAVDDFQAFVDELMNRKRKLFDDHKRLVISYELAETRTDFHLSVASTLTSDLGHPR